MSKELALKIAKVVKKKPEATIAEIAAELDEDPEQVAVVLSDYLPTGERAGPGGGGGWTEQ